MAATSSSAPTIASNASAVPAASGSGTRPFRHTPHAGALPGVPPTLVALRDVVKDLGQIRLGETGDHTPAIICKGCVRGNADEEITFSRPPTAGSFSARGKRELVLDGEGTCGVQGHQWGCLLLVGEGPAGRTVTRIHPARSGATHVHAHRIENERDLLIGLFAGWQEGGT